jgi:two-component system response regulator PilR (NtrC family)
MQVKLLRAIQEKSVRPVGASEEQKTDIRLLSATHKDLAREVEAGRFRQDLYYRINVIGVLVPSLRQRLEDLPELTTAILRRISPDGKAARLDKSALAALSQYSFPGNVRELENMLERALALSHGEKITAEDLQISTVKPMATAEKAADTTERAQHGRSVREAYGDLEGYLEDLEREIISAALEECRWNKTATAKLLGITFRSLRYRQKKLGLDD